MTEEELLAEAVTLAKTAGLPGPSHVSVRDRGTAYQMGMVFRPFSTDLRLEISSHLLTQAPQPVVRALTAHEVGHILDHSALNTAVHVARKWAINVPVIAVIIGLMVAGQATGTSWLGSLSAAMTGVVIVVAGVTGLVLRRQEYKADEFAARLVGAEQVADALQWVREHDRRPQRTAEALPSTFSSHPRMEERIRRLGTLGD